MSAQLHTWLELNDILLLCHRHILFIKIGAAEAGWTDYTTVTLVMLPLAEGNGKLGPANRLSLRPFIHTGIRPFEVLERDGSILKSRLRQSPHQMFVPSVSRKHIC